MELTTLQGVLPQTNLLRVRSLAVERDLETEGEVLGLARKGGKGENRAQDQTRNEAGFSDVWVRYSF